MRLPILTYHSILPVTKIELIPSPEERIYTLTDSIFEQQMKYLKDNGYTTISFSGIKNYLNSSYDLPPHPVILTFDDGRIDNYYNVFPVFEKYGLKATFFIVTDFVGKMGYLNWDQIYKMSLSGMEIQSHTHKHRNLSELSKKEILEDLALSKEILEQRINKKIDVLALPYGRGDNKSVKEIALSLGYLFICTSNHGGNNIKRNTFYLKRLSIKVDANMRQFESFIELRKTSLLIYNIKKMPITMMKKILRKNKYDKLRKILLERL